MKLAPLIHQSAQPRPMGRLPAVLLLVIAAAGLPACDGNDPTGTNLTAPIEAADASGEAGAAAAEMTAAPDQTAAATASTIPLPINQSKATSGPLFGLTQTGTGFLGVFGIQNTTSGASAVLAQTNGATGIAVRGTATGTNGIAGFFASSNGISGLFRNSNSSNASAALRAETSGGGPALHAVTKAQGNAGVFENTSSTNANPVLAVTNRGGGFAAVFLGTAQNSKGVLIQTAPGVAGLQVVGGTKNAVVATPGGAKALYTEESSEVWFTDYGFGRLEHGRARILFDPSFAQTINSNERYHVFLQPRGRAELYLGETTPLGFEVLLKDGDPNAEFSYRIVAKRLGFEQKRLEPAPWVDRLASGGGQGW